MTCAAVAEAPVRFWMHLMPLWLHIRSSSASDYCLPQRTVMWVQWGTTPQPRRAYRGKAQQTFLGRKWTFKKKKKNNQNVRLSACPALHHLGRNNRMQCKATWPLSAGRQQRFAAVIKGTTPVVPLTSCEMFFELHSPVLRLEVVLLYKSNAYVNYIGWSSQYWKNWGRGMLSHSRKVDVSKHRVETRVRPK